MTIEQIYHRLNMPTAKQVRRVQTWFTCSLILGLLLLAMHSHTIDGCVNAREIATLVILRGVIITLVGVSGTWAFQRLHFHAGRKRRGD